MSAIKKYNQDRGEFYEGLAAEDVPTDILGVVYAAAGDAVRGNLQEKLSAGDNISFEIINVSATEKKLRIHADIPSSSVPLPEKVAFVSPVFSDESPYYATVASAVANFDFSSGGVIVVYQGTYTDEVVLPAYVSLYAIGEVWIENIDIAALTSIAGDLLTINDLTIGGDNVSVRARSINSMSADVALGDSIVEIASGGMITLGNNSEGHIAIRGTWSALRSTGAAVCDFSGRLTTSNLRFDNTSETIIHDTTITGDYTASLFGYAKLRLHNCRVKFESQGHFQLQGEVRLHVQDCKIVSTDVAGIFIDQKEQVTIADSTLISDASYTIDATNPTTSVHIHAGVVANVGFNNIYEEIGSATIATAVSLENW